MDSHRKNAASALGVVLTLLIPCQVIAQAPAPPAVPAPPPTVWQKLGVTKVVKALKGKLINPKGNHPFLEPKPPLKMLADPANLESPVKAIKVAAELKMAEDLKQQKIKAIKYLTKVGCGCYNTDGAVTEAIVEAASDCTEEVRFATIQAISDAAGECSCSKCGEVNCCKKDILMKLAEIAYERDDHGCYLEPSERVRELAASTLAKCCPNRAPPTIVPTEEEEPKAEPKEDREVPEDADKETPEDTDTDGSETNDGESDDAEADEAESDQEPEELPPATPVTLDLNSFRPHFESPSRSTRFAARRSPSAAANKPYQQPKPASALKEFSLRTGPNDHDARLAAPEPLKPSAPGVVFQVSPQHNLAHIHFTDRAFKPAVGSLMKVYQETRDGDYFLCSVRVVDGFEGCANVEALSSAHLKSVQQGDLVKISVPRTALK